MARVGVRRRGGQGHGRRGLAQPLHPADRRLRGRGHREQVGGGGDDDDMMMMMMI